MTQLTGFAPDVLVAMERNVLLWLHNDISTISPMRVVQLYLERLGHYLPEFKAIDRWGGSRQRGRAGYASNAREPCSASGKHHSAGACGQSGVAVETVLAACLVRDVIM